ncbi:mannose-6-phosphate isomerase, class I [Amycolatopsis jejuensis]|uniref:mannose-6-phosphate isomerase, class I n=1 Tax=Amycolatopsis jejuensis TaxID=330084 RepID=UPI0007C485A1|nr:mannose-6-phosphate isomerase, class I [Amycolatopsis jejuensis]
MDRLVTAVRRYEWGSRTAIPALRGVPPDGEPQAELWMGASSRVGEVPLSAVIEADPAGVLGAEVVRAFGPRLPFLLKVLAVERPLSLQVHPDPAQAAAGFADEERRGVPLDAPHRTYRDPHHKPEMLYALTPFTGLSGFRPPASAADLLARLDVPAVRPYVEALRAGGDALRVVMSAILAQERQVTAEMVGAVRGLEEPYAGLAALYPGDPGVIAALLLNVVRLRAGAALYVGAGVPHAYLSGMGVEIMSDSDNVLRCGLTRKHVDVPGLLQVVRFEPQVPEVVRGMDVGGETVYPVPAREFRLSRVAVEGERVVGCGGPQILLCTQGRVEVRTLASAMVLRGGDSVFVPAGECSGSEVSDRTSQERRAACETRGTGEQGVATKIPSTAGETAETRAESPGTGCGGLRLRGTGELFRAAPGTEITSCAPSSYR